MIKTSMASETAMMRLLKVNSESYCGTNVRLNKRESFEAGKR